jgi:hypothetical protein
VSSSTPSSICILSRLRFLLFLALPFFHSYRLQTQRLTDLVRTTLTFADLGDLADCLEALEADQEVSDLKIKNRFHPSYQDIAGYRDVCVLVAGRLTCGLICEVQLNVESVYACKSSSGHARYVQMRDARGD